MASRTVLAALQVCLTMALAACAAALQVNTPAGEQAAGSKPAIPPGQRVEQFSLCYELRRTMASPAEQPVKRFSIDVSILVPQDDCLALDADGWLRVVPGRCGHTPAKKSFCEEKP